MRPESAPDRTIGRIAAAQGGVVSLHQLRLAGLSPEAIKRRMRAGRLHPRHRGVEERVGPCARIAAHQRPSGPSAAWPTAYPRRPGTRVLRFTSEQITERPTYVIAAPLPRLPCERPEN